MLAHVVRRTTSSILLRPILFNSEISNGPRRVIGAIPQGNFVKHNFSSMAATVDYDYVVKAKDNPQILIVDVREPDEVTQTGIIPNSVNIPVATVAEAFNEAPGGFKSKYKKDKPNNNTEVIFYCQAGRRAEKAAQAALGLGFKNCKIYGGSWSDWSSKQ